MEDKIGGVYSAHGEMRNAHRSLARKPERTAFACLKRAYTNLIILPYATIAAEKIFMKFDTGKWY
jgi:hypothetical protein